MQELYRELFKEIPEAKDDKELLAKVIQRVEGAHPGLEPKEIFKKIPAEYRATKSAQSQLQAMDMTKLNETVNGVL